MNDAIHTLRHQIRTHTQARTGTSVRYPAPVRDAAIALARERTHAGISIRRTAHELGLRPPTLYLWLSRRQARRLRPVSITETPEPAAERGGIRPVLVTPHGYRIEALDLAALIALLRSLS